MCATSHSAKFAGIPFKKSLQYKYGRTNTSRSAIIQLRAIVEALASGGIAVPVCENAPASFAAKAATQTTRLYS
jgi:hypothetical protein